ncbi:MAG: decaprenyl-phosphate phosphoribosyltransferase [Nitrospirae bacterium]|nr:MAG: decaprenyl-phosphate phosphoribosyltransferase [Nitrospirota bacterium]
MLIAYIRLLRAHHWLKNLFLFAAPFFGGALLREDVLLLALPVFLTFSFGTTSIYIFNDIIDRDTDLLHPRKMHRPIASGKIGVNTAAMLSIFFLFISLFASYRIERLFFFYLLLYILVQALYTVKLKTLPIVDIFSVAAGFVIRVFAGGAAFHVRVSPWLFLTMFMISLVLASGKRLSEFTRLKENAIAHRTSLRHYSEGLLKNMLTLSSSASLICYALYTLEQSITLVYTVPVVTFGLFRYLMNVEKGYGDATEAMFKDRVLSVTVGGWLLIIYLLRY